MNLLDNPAVKNDGSVECSAAIQYTADQANSKGQTLSIPAGVYNIGGTVTFKNIIVEAEFGAVFEHSPINDETDCVRITGSNTGRSKLTGLTIRRPSACNFGRDLLKIDKGDYVTVEDVYIDNAKRNGVHVVPYGSYQWIENLILNRVKVNVSGQDSFAFTISGAQHDIFINQVDMIQCESRSATRQALRLENLNTGNNATKIANFRFMNCEFHVDPNLVNIAPPEQPPVWVTTDKSAEPIIAILAQQAGGNSACIENLTFGNCAVEDTKNRRTGNAIFISGRMQGKFEFKNSIMYGTDTDIVGHDLFPVYEIEDIAAPIVPLLKSHIGVWKKYTTGSLAPDAFEGTVSMPANEIIEGWVFNSSGVFARFTAMNGTYLYVHNATKCLVELVSGVIRLTNKDTASRTLNLHLQRITKN